MSCSSELNITHTLNLKGESFFFPWVLPVRSVLKIISKWSQATDILSEW